MAEEPDAQDEPQDERDDAEVDEADARASDSGSYPDPVIVDDDESGELRGPRADDDGAEGELRGPRFSTERLAAGEVGATGDDELRDAYESLQIRTPLEEFETYARARLETLVRLGESERAAVTSDAMKLGLDALRHVMGGNAPREAP